MSYTTWSCCRSPTQGIPQDERHSYEKCLYVDFTKRKAKQDELRAEKAGAQKQGD